MRRKLLFLLLAALLLTIPAGARPAPEMPESGTVYIRTAEDLRSLAEQAVLDTWSAGRTVVLLADIDLQGETFTPIPLFAGTFDGRGHTLSGLVMADCPSLCGVFCRVLEGGTVRDLHVEATVGTQSESETLGGIAGSNAGTISGCSFSGLVVGAAEAGGIAGLNDLTGRIENCTSDGELRAKQYAGGVAGRNYGTIFESVSRAAVNTAADDSQTTLEELENLLLDPSRLLDTAAEVSDTGGITGYSDGKLVCCVNEGTVGYEHVGYNVGGIAGRSSGYVCACTNRGAVFGRKDVGGIVGQMEPELTLEYLENKVAMLQQELDSLHTMVGTAIGHATGTVANVSAALQSAMGDVETAGIGASSMADALGAWVNNMASALSGGTWDVLNGDLPDVPALSGEFSSGASAMRGSLTAAAEKLRAAAASLGGSGGQLASDLYAINDQANVVSDLAASIAGDTQAAVTDIQNTDISDLYTDISTSNLLNYGAGCVTGCDNSGDISGDLNAGGIVGTLAVETDLDPEDDITKNGENSPTFQYQSFAIVRASTNTGFVTAKKNCAGGVVGRMDMGVLYRCAGYGPVTSLDGSYTGGVCGQSDATIRLCWAKCRLSGLDYVGGIVGSGTIVADCCAMAAVDSFTQYAGAISGSVDGTFSGNTFVAVDRQGIDRFDYAGQAEPLSYEQLLADPDTPDAFRRFTLTFRVDGAAADRVDFLYGESLTDDQIPDPPAREGYYAVWSRTDFSALTFDETVEAVYTRDVTALASSGLRRGGPAILLAEGRFTESESLEAVQYGTDGFPALFPGGFASVPAALRAGTLRTDGFLPLRALEHWKTSVPSDGRAERTVRYLPEEGSGTVGVYERTDGGWTLLDSAREGSYLTFSIAGDKAELMFVRVIQIRLVPLYALLTVLGLAVLVGAAWLLALRLESLWRRRRRRRGGLPAFGPEERTERESGASP